MVETLEKLEHDVASARLRTLDWLETLQVPGQPRGVVRISAAHDPGEWPGMMLPGTYNAVMCRDLLEGGIDWPAGDRAALVAWLLQHRTASGVFRVPGMNKADTYKKPDPEETRRYIDFHVTNYTLGAIEALRVGDVPVLDFIKSFLDPQTLKAWLCERDLRDPWQEGNNIVNLAGFLLLLRRHKSEHAESVDAALEIMFDWHDRLQEPSSGFWGVNQSDPLCALHAMAGSMHNFHIWYETGRRLSYQDCAVDYALGQPTEANSACIDVDLVDLLVHAHGIIDYRRGEIEAWLRAKLQALLALQQNDGGFWDEPHGIRRQDGWVRGYTEPQGLSNTFATWFRWIGIAMIADLLRPGAHVWKFRREIGIGYRARLRR